MSHDATNWAIKQRGLKPAAKILLWHLADCHNPSHGCFPSQEYLAEHAEMSERGVRRHLEELEGFGLILREKVKQSGRFDRTEYTLNLHVVHSPPAKLTTGQNVSPPPAKMGTHHRPNCPPNLVSEPVKEPVIEQMDLLPKPKPRRAQQMPEGWVPNDTNVQDAIDRNFSQQEISHEADKFRNYCHANGKTYKNFDAAWRNWLGNARDYKNRRMAGGSINGGGGQAGGLAGAYARRHLGG